MVVARGAADGFLDTPTLGVVGVGLGADAGQLVVGVPDEGLAAPAGQVAVGVPGVAGNEGAAVAAASRFLQLVGIVVDVGERAAACGSCLAVVPDVVGEGLVCCAGAVGAAGAGLDSGQPGEGVEAVLQVFRAEAAEGFGVAISAAIPAGAIATVFGFRAFNCV